jgi:AraC-like ligand binding domain
LDRTRKSGHGRSKSGQVRDTALLESLTAYDPDRLSAPVVALLVDVKGNDQEVPMHRHVRGQLVMTFRGAVTCEVMDALWLVPPDCGLWIPGGSPHKSVVSADGVICYLYILPAAISLPNMCCTLSLTPLVRELIRHMAYASAAYSRESPEGRIAAVLLEQLGLMDIEKLHLPVPANARLRKITDALLAAPATERRFWSGQTMSH